MHKILFAILAVIALPTRVEGQVYETLAPYAAIRWEGQTPEVTLDGRWYSLRSIDDVAVDEIVAFCDKTWPDRGRKRFEEDLVEAMTMMGHKPGGTVALELLDLESRKVVKRASVPMTHENRQSIWRAASAPRAREMRPPKGDDYEKLAPYAAIRWEGEAPEVTLDGRWYPLRSIDDVATGEIVAFCRKTWSDRWRKRFEEDLVEAMTKMGHKPGGTVALELIDLESRKVVKRASVLMTHENRQAIWAAAFAREAAVRRSHSPATASPLTREQAVADLDQLAQQLRAEYAYWFRGARLFEGELEKATAALPPEVSLVDFACTVQELLSLFGDGHTGVLDLDEILPRGYLPFLVADCGGRLVAFRSDRRGLVDATHPFVKSLDGLPIERWLTAAGELVARGSPAFVRRQAAGMLRYLQVVRRRLGVAEGAEIVVELIDERGRSSTTKLAVSDRYPVYGEWPRMQTRRLEGDLGYLRIASMEEDDAFVAALHAAMASFGDTRGLVIDVRSNGGGSRRVLLELFPYFMKADDPPHLANVAACRIDRGAPADADGLLADRFLFPIGSARFNASERKLLEGFAARFKPEWTLPKGEFSAWNYLLLRPELPAGRARYERPVVILQDGGCFSATDIFLGAFKGWRDVTLLGTASGGGSGRARKLELTHSALTLRASTMASFRPDGAPYDGYGIEPDVVVAPQPSDLVGASDAQLEAAIALLKKRR